jgi:hypothetical protein
VLIDGEAFLPLTDQSIGNVDQIGRMANAFEAGRQFTIAKD